jgi:hypothetical protein
MIVFYINKKHALKNDYFLCQQKTFAQEKRQILFNSIFTLIL